MNKYDIYQNLQNNQNSQNIAKLLDDTDAVLTYQLGLFTRFMFAGIYVQPEAMFSSSQTEMTFENIIDGNGNTNNVVGEMKLNKLDVPVMIGKNGVEKILEIELENNEKSNFDVSINAVKELCNAAAKIDPVLGK